MHFIYVMSEQDKDKMISLGYMMMKEDTRNHIWVFKARDTEKFSSNEEISKAGIHFILSNTLTF